MSTVVWYHCLAEYNMDETAKDAAHEKKLVNAFPQLLIFTDIDNCIDYICNCALRTIYLILSDAQGVQALSLVYRLEQFVCAYVLEYISPIRYAADYIFIKNCPIAFGPFKQLTKLIGQVHCHMTSSEGITVGFTNPFNLLVDRLNTIDDIDEQQNERLHFQVILASLLRSHTSTDFVRQIMIDECREHHTRTPNIFQLQKIDNFDQKESQFSTIQWWSEDCFVYRLINSALRSRHWRSIMKYRYFIVKLHNAIEKLHQEQFPIIKIDDPDGDEDLHNQILVYRGQGIFLHDLKVLESNIGGLVSINSFLSTSLVENVGIKFAHGCLEEKSVAVKFQIMLDRRISSTIFANISTISKMPDEAEVLLSLGTVFRVKDVMRDNMLDQWIVNLVATDAHTDPLLSFMLSEFETKSLGQVLCETGEYDAARDYCELMLKYTNDHLTHYSILGNVLKEMEEYDQALENHYRALQLVTSINQCPAIYYNIGLAYLGKGDSNRALHYYHKADELECVKGETMQLAEIYHDMGLAYIDIGVLRRGVNYLEKALHIQNTVLPSNHRHLGYTYTHLGDYYRDQNENRQALEYYQHALDIFRHSQRHDHRLVYNTHYRIATLYLAMGQYDMITKTFDQLAQTYGRTANGLALACIHMNIIRYILFPTGNLRQCVTCAKYALSIREQHLPADHKLIGITLYILGSFQLTVHKRYCGKHNLSTLIDSQKNLVRAIEILKPYPGYFRKTIENLAFVYHELEQYDEAVKCFQESIENSSEDDPSLPRLYKNLASVCGELHQFKNAIGYLKDALRLYNQSSLGIADPEIIRSHALLGVFFKRTKCYKMALKHLSIALSLWRITACPTDADAVIGAVYYHTADIYYKLNLEYPSYVAQLFHFWNAQRYKQLESLPESSLTSSDSDPGYITGLRIIIAMELE